MANVILTNLDPKHTGNPTAQQKGKPPMPPLFLNIWKVNGGMDVIMATGNHGSISFQSTLYGTSRGTGNSRKVLLIFL